MGNRLNGATTLHVACTVRSGEGGRYPACKLPSPELTGLLLAVGADPCAVDNSGCTPLHMAAAAAQSSCASALARVLLDNGAHLDAVDGTGRTFAQLLAGGQQLHKLLNPLPYTSLACLAARSIRRHKVPYRGVIPISLEAFVQQH